MVSAILPPKIITVFGATGNQGSGVINTVLAVPNLKARYALRAVTRDVESEKSQTLKAKGIEVVKADLNDVESLKAAVRGSYGVFGMTDFWSIHSAEIEVQQGKNIFTACKEEGVAHLVYSSLPWATKLTDGVLSRLAHFDSKASVEEFVEANKGNMIASYFMPAMFLGFLPNLIRIQNGVPTIILPYPSEDVAWPLIDPPQDGGKFIMGLFEGGKDANGARVNAVSCWITPRELATELSKASGREVVLKIVPPDEFAKDFPDNLATELTETLRIAGEYSVYGKGQKAKQHEHNKWLVEGSDPLLTLQQWINQQKPWTFKATGFLDILAEQKRNQKS